MIVPLEREMIARELRSELSLEAKLLLEVLINFEASQLMIRAMRAMNERRKERKRSYPTKEDIKVYLHLLGWKNKEVESVLKELTNFTKELLCLS